MIDGRRFDFNAACKGGEGSNQEWDRVD